MSVFSCDKTKFYLLMCFMVCSNTLVIEVFELCNDAGHIVCSSTLLDVWSKYLLHHVYNNPSEIIAFEIVFFSLLSNDLA